MAHWGGDGRTEGRTSGNSPLCPTGHRPFGAAAQKGKVYGKEQRREEGREGGSKRGRKEGRKEGRIEGFSFAVFQLVLSISFDHLLLLAFIFFCKLSILVRRIFCHRHTTLDILCWYIGLLVCQFVCQSITLLVHPFFWSFSWCFR